MRSSQGFGTLPSRRVAVRGRRGGVCTEQPLASEAAMSK